MCKRIFSCPCPGQILVACGLVVVCACTGLNVDAHGRSDSVTPCGGLELAAKAISETCADLSIFSTLSARDDLIILPETALGLCEQALAKKFPKEQMTFTN